MPVHTLQYMTPKQGDARQLWNPKKPDEVEIARRIFDDLKAKGYIAYTVKGRESRGELVDVFDPELGKIVLVPPMAGG